jgi:ribonucleoside-diphosphate reductase alpha chain
MDTIATMTSIALQYGVPLKTLVDKFSHTRFEPSGFTNNREIPIAKSVMDYVFRFLGNRFLQNEEKVVDIQEVSIGESEKVAAIAPAAQRAAVAGGAERRPSAVPSVIVNQADAPSCSDCGSIMIRSGTCHNCPNCGLTSGCS